MISKLRDTISGYPRQFWILFVGTLVSASGGSLVWPFMTIYVHEKLEVPLATVGLVLAANSASGLFSQLAGGPVVDRFGRKIAMKQEEAAADRRRRGYRCGKSRPGQR